MMGLFESALVIARRDIVATVYTRTFLLFLLGPLVPILFAVYFGHIGEDVGRGAAHPRVAVVASEAEYAAISAAHGALAAVYAEKTLPDLLHALPDYDPADQVKALLAARDKSVIAVLTGGVAAPKLTGAIAEDGSVRSNMRLIVTEARQRAALGRAGAEVRPVDVALEQVGESAGSLAAERRGTAFMAQTLIFVITTLLSTMLLSNFIEEKSNKVVEVLAAAVPVDAIFLGKLFAMLAISLTGIAVWGAAGIVAQHLWGGAGDGLATPAVGWPAFLILALFYFSANYLLLGGVFLGIGAQASSIREVQTLSMPATVGQLLIFGLAILAGSQIDGLVGIGAALFPFSSPLTMVARATLAPELWPHLLAIAWQLLWVAAIVMLAAGLFRRNVLKSGSGGSRPARR